MLRRVRALPAKYAAGSGSGASANFFIMRGTNRRNVLNWSLSIGSELLSLKRFAKDLGIFGFHELGAHCREAHASRILFCGVVATLHHYAVESLHRLPCADSVLRVGRAMCEA